MCVCVCVCVRVCLSVPTAVQLKTSCKDFISVSIGYAFSQHSKTSLFLINVFPQLGRLLIMTKYSKSLYVSLIEALHEIFHKYKSQKTCETKTLENTMTLRIPFQICVILQEIFNYVYFLIFIIF